MQLRTVDRTLETAILATNLLPVELTIHDHYGRETKHVLHRLPAVMGRDEGADVQLTDPWISHRHCEIDQIGDVLVVRDLNSKNGIFMGGHRVRESAVHSGEQFIVGRTEIIVHCPGITRAEMETEVGKPAGQKQPQPPLPDTWELP